MSMSMQGTSSYLFLSRWWSYFILPCVLATNAFIRLRDIVRDGNALTSRPLLSIRTCRVHQVAQDIFKRKSRFLVSQNIRLKQGETGFPRGKDTILSLVTNMGGTIRCGFIIYFVIITQRIYQVLSYITVLIIASTSGHHRTCWICFMLSHYLSRYGYYCTDRGGHSQIWSK